MRAADGVSSSNTSSDEEGIFHNSSQNSASVEETSRVVRALRDSRNLILEADAPMINIVVVLEILYSVMGYLVHLY